MRLPSIVSVPIDKDWYYGIIDTCYFSCLLNGNKVSEKYIQNKRACVDQETGEVTGYFGYINNLKFYWNDEKLVLKEGSIAKYFCEGQSHNLDLLIWSQYKQVIKELSKKLGVNLIKARIYRLDTTYDINIGSMSASSLVDLFEYRKGMVKMRADNGSLYYLNKSKRRSKNIHIYDKTSKMKEDGFFMAGDNLMRFEVKYFSLGITRYMKRYAEKILTVGDLFDRNMFIDLVRAIAYEYFLISKKKISYFNLKANGKPGDIHTQLELAGIEHYGGIENVLAMIDVTKSKIKPPYSTFYSKIKAKAKRISRNRKCTKEYEAISFLNSQVEITKRCSVLHIGVID